MIKTIADFLHALMQREAEELQGLAIPHGPTIGDMYEGLTQEILTMAMPGNLGLRVVSGFVEDGRGALSGQIDCMLVVGTGRKIPRLKRYIWHIKDVIAVLEIKKNLYSRELADAFDHLETVHAVGVAYVKSGDAYETMNIGGTLMNRAFSQITGHLAPNADNYLTEFPKAPPFDRAVYSALLNERVGTIRVVFGYRGFKNEKNFRDALHEVLAARSGKRGIGIAGLPHLVVSGRHVLVKANGMPYAARSTAPDQWNFYATTEVTNPLMILLELIWTRIGEDFTLRGQWGDDLDVEVMHLFMSARLEQIGDTQGWGVTPHLASSRVLKRTSGLRPWQPVILDEDQVMVLAVILKVGHVDFANVEVWRWAAGRGLDLDALQKELLASRLVAMDGSRMELITENCKVLALPDGRFAAEDDNTGRLTRWARVKYGANFIEPEQE